MDDYSKIFIALTVSFIFIGLAYISKLSKNILKKKENTENDNESTAPIKENQEIDNSISTNQNQSVDEIGISPYEKFETMQNDSEVVQKSWWQQFEDYVNKFQDYWDEKIWDFWTNQSGVPEFWLSIPKSVNFWDNLKLLFSVVLLVFPFFFMRSLSML